MEQIVLYLLIVKKFIDLKQNSEIVPNVLCLGNNSKDVSADNMEKAELNGYVYDFSVDYAAVPVVVI